MENILVFFIVLGSVILLARFLSKGSKGDDCSNGCSSGCKNSSCMKMDFDEKEE